MDLIKYIKNRQAFYIYKSFNELLSNNFDLSRILVSYLALSNLSLNLNIKTKNILLNKMLSLQKCDGGFVDVKESLYALEVFKMLNYEESALKCNEWILCMVHEDGGVSLHPRDTANLPLTCLVFETFNRLEISTCKDYDMQKFIISSWSNDLSLNGLTYKAGRFLSCYPCLLSSFKDENLLENTLIFLNDNIQFDGGFSPNKKLNLPSSPYITSIVIRGLLNLNLDNEIVTKLIDKSLNFLLSNSAENEGWSEHEKDFISSTIINNLSNTRSEIYG